MLAAKMEKLQYKVIMTPRYGAQLSQEEFSTAVTRKNTLLIGRKTEQNGTETSLYSWRVSDPSSLIHKETEDEDGQVAPGAFGLLALERIWWRRGLEICLCVTQEEDLADNVFAQRHLELEDREKSRWASWGTRKCHRRPKRWSPHSHWAHAAGGTCRMKPALSKEKQLWSPGPAELLQTSGSRGWSVSFFSAFPDVATDRLAAEVDCWHQERRAQQSGAGLNWILTKSNAPRSGWWDQKSFRWIPHPSTPETKSCLCDQIILTWGFRCCFLSGCV